MWYAIGQFIGFVNLAVFVISFQCKDKKPMMQLRAVSKLIVCFHYYLIGAASGLVTSFFGIFPNYFAYKYEDCKHHERNITIAIFIVIFIVFGALFYRNIYDIIPIAASILTLFPLFMKGTKHVRTFQFIISPLYLIYCVETLSYAGIISELVVLVSSTVGMLRFDKK